MPQIQNSKGDTFDVSDVDAAKMTADDPSLKVLGDVAVTPEEQGTNMAATSGERVLATEGAAPASGADTKAYDRRQYLADKTSAVGAAFRGGLGGLSLGASDDWFDPETIEADQAHHGLARGLGTVGGAIIPGLVGDEGGLAGLLREPTSVESASSAMSSKYLFGGEIGAKAGTEGRAVELGLTKAGTGMEAATKAGAIPEDLAGLKAARDTELGTIEASRVPQRQQIVDELTKFRSSLKEDDKIFLATKGIKEAELPEGVEGLKIQEIGKVSFEADKAVDRLLRNPIRLAEKPEIAMGALQQQENALLQLQKREPTLREMFAADESGTRAASLDAVPAALERNRALQQSIRSVIAEPASARLSAIDAAIDALNAPAAPKSLAEDMLGGTIMGHVAGLFSGMPIIGPVIGAKAGRLAQDLVFGRMGKAVAGAGKKASAAAETFLNVAKNSMPTLPLAATKILSGVSFGPTPRGSSASPEPKKGKATLPELFKARTDEIKAQTAYDMTGTPRMRPEARAEMAKRLAPIRVLDPELADKLETNAAARIEFLASKIPRRPDIGGLPMGPDHWQPSDMEMRTFARYVHAVEDPGAVEHRLAHGMVSPEDAEAYHTAYPARAAALKQKVIAGLPTLRQTLPYNKRLAFSIFTGVPVDPSMHPAVMNVLQGSFKSEPGSSMGTQSPSPSPQFGSVARSANQDQTPAQQRALGTR